MEALADRLLFMRGGEAIYTGTLEGFRGFARNTLPPSVWRPNMSMEELYLAFVPQKQRITWEETA